MKTLTSLVLFALVSSLIFGGITSSAYAQDDPTVLLKIAQKAQDQIKQNISSNSSEKIQQLYKEGSSQVDALNQAITNNDTESAKNHFLSAMRIFKEISQLLTQNEPQRTEMASRTMIDDPTSNLLKLYRYAYSLKTVSEAHHTQIDFTKLYDLFGVAREQITSKQFNDAQETINQIKQIINDIEKQLREQAAQQESERAKKYAQNYLEQLDRLIENAKNQGISDDIIEKLEDARTRLSSASSPEEIVKEIRKIISIKDQFELTKNDRLESRIMQLEKTLQKLSQTEKVDSETIQNARENLVKVKSLMKDGEFDQANDLLRDLANQLNNIVKSLS
jgi:flagellin-specific chaperone FliS